MTSRSAKFPYVTSRGFTLIELLAVIVIITLTAGTVSVGLASANTSAQLQAAESRWRDLDARGRTLGRALGPVTMHYEAQHALVQLSLLDSGEQLAEITLPRKASARLVTDRPTDRIVFDRLGRSPDYNVTVTLENRLVAWHICGLTGYITEPRR